MKEENIKTTTGFAEFLEFDKGSLSKILNAKSPCPASLLESISRVYNINIEWLQTGKGEMTTEVAPITSESKGVPYFDVDFTLGFDILLNDQTTQPEYYVDFPPYNKCTCWISARGDSMTPTISAGDMIALQHIDDFRYLISGEIYAIVTKNGLRTIKRVNDKGETLLLIPDNKSYEEQLIPKSEIISVFYVKGCMKAY
jgi:SOS-response transcriptional repressor LexA